MFVKFTNEVGQKFILNTDMIVTIIPADEPSDDTYNTVIHMVPGKCCVRETMNQVLAEIR